MPFRGSYWGVCGVATSRWPAQGRQARAVDAEVVDELVRTYGPAA
ncbi:hypothetical protein [Streptomyces sp. NPDC051219]